MRTWGAAAGVLALTASAALAGGYSRPGEASPAGDLAAGKAAAGALSLDYTPACNAPDHALVWGRGPIEGAVSWQGLLCGLGSSGAAEATLPDPAPGEWLYFVLVGQDGSFEGSYGRDGGGVERPEGAGFAACERPRTLQASCVAVDFSAPLDGVRSQSGFLHSLSGPDPPDDRVAPLRPAQWRRHDFSDYGRVTGLGARFTVVLSDMWGYPNGTWGWPFQRWGVYEAWVRSVAQANRGTPAVWDVWNEPDIAYFWGGTVEQWLETYRRTYAILREELGPDALIAGPSLSGFNRPWIVRFLDDCRAQGCEVNVLTWHELGGGIPSIDDRLRDARASWLDSPDYAALDLREIQVNEIIGSGHMHAPGAILAFFFYLEAGRSDGACKACWGESNGVPNCDNASLDGLLVPGSHATRSGWWAYKAYAEGFPSRVAASTADPGLVALAGRDVGDLHHAQVALGSFDPGGAPGTSAASLTLSRVDRLPFVSSGRVRVRLERIPNTGEGVLEAPLVVSETLEDLVNGALLLRLSSVAVNEAWLVTLSAP